MKGVEALHPAVRWRVEALRPPDAARHGNSQLLRLRLAAMAGHMASDRRAARRCALIDLLADGRPHTGEAIRARLSAALGGDPWGKRPDETLLRDFAALRRGGIRVAYSRRGGTEGYYLQYPALERTADDRRPMADDRPPPTGANGGKRLDDQWTRRLRDMSVPEKNATAFGAADFALRQKRLILAEERPDWPPEAVDREARRLVFGV